MTEIRVFQSIPRAGWWTVTFVPESGTFSNEVLTAVNKATGNIGRFCAGRAYMLAVTSTDDNKQQALAALEILKQHHPDAAFVTYDGFTRELFGDKVKQVLL